MSSCRQYSALQLLQIQGSCAVFSQIASDLISGILPLLPCLHLIPFHLIVGFCALCASPAWLGRGGEAQGIPLRHHLLQQQCMVTVRRSISYYTSKSTCNSDSTCFESRASFEAPQNCFESRSGPRSRRLSLSDSSIHATQVESSEIA